MKVVGIITYYNNLFLQIYKFKKPYNNYSNK